MSFIRKETNKNKAKTTHALHKREVTLSAFIKERIRVIMNNTAWLFVYVRVFTTQPSQSSSSAGAGARAGGL